MAKFIWKPEVIDFGYEPGTKEIKFIHEGTNITIEQYPSWMSDVSVEFTAWSSGRPEKGKITATVGYDAPFKYSTGYITVYCDGESFLVPVVYNYDSEHIPIVDVIDTVLLDAGDEAFINKRDRIKAISAAKRWLQDNGGVTGTNIRMAELPVENNAIRLPGDFVDYVGLYIVSEDGYLAPLYWNENINIGQENLQDQEYFYLLDGSGNVIGAHGLTPRVDNENPYTYYGIDVPALKNLNGGQKTVNIQPGQVSFNGAYRLDRVNREFIIDGPAVDKVVLEYVSDPILRQKIKMDIGELRVHKQYREALETYLYYKLIEIKRAAPLYEKQRALRAYKLAMKRARAKQINLPELIQVLKGNK